ncbi:flagellin [Bacillus cereus]|uniref:flagellin N-terminal helical domain-containing protein n=1 Tax=Bacillus cereus TaxID=1396 RepID=UPI0035C7525A
MRINTNINSLRTQEYMRQNQSKMSTAMDRLSSGKRINNASDDAAGLAIATRMKARQGGLNVAARNTQDGISLIRTADSALNSVSNILLRMRDLANQSATGTNTDTNKVALQKEFTQLKEQIDYIAANTQFNDKNLLDGSSDQIKIQTLDSDDASKQIEIKLNSSTLEALKIKDLAIGSEGASKTQLETLTNKMDALKTVKAADVSGMKTAVDEAKTAFEAVKSYMAPADVATLEGKFKDFDGKSVAADQETSAKAIQTSFDTISKSATMPKAAPNASASAATMPKAAADADALGAVKQIDVALKTIADNQATLGATLNRLEFNVTNLKSQENSMASSASQIEDADMAKEMSEMTKFKILNEAGISMLSQANQTPQMVSKLLQ